MNWHDNVLALIDTRSFSNLWFWLALAAIWSGMTNSSLGVPLDMIQAARRRGGQAMTDMESMVDLQTRRRGELLRRAGLPMLLIWSGLMSFIVVLGFAYGIELAQAFSFLLVPLTFAGFLQANLVARQTRAPLEGLALAKRLLRHRIGIQAIGLLAILLTTLWGMWHNINQSVLG